MSMTPFGPVPLTPTTAFLDRARVVHGDTRK